MKLIWKDTWNSQWNPLITNISFPMDSVTEFFLGFEKTSWKKLFGSPNDTFEHIQSKILHVNLLFLFITLNVYCHLGKFSWTISHSSVQRSGTRCINQFAYFSNWKMLTRLNLNYVQNKEKEKRLLSLY